MPPTILIRQPDTLARRLQSLEDPGRRSGSVAGSYMADRVALRKLILLCPFHVHKFNPKRVDYEPFRRYTLRGHCDDCKQFWSSGLRGFIHASTHDAVGDPELHHRQRARLVRLGR